MAHFPDEGQLIHYLWDALMGHPTDDQLTLVSEEYANWHQYYNITHPVYDGDAPDAPSLGDLIESLKMFCDCGHCDGAWVTRFEANHIVAKLKRLAELESENP
jgi:hypothetical protein